MRRLVLMGSGETAPTMMPIHRRVLADAGAGTAVILDTPFGFQTNADDLVEKTSTYFRESVGREVKVASWRRRDAATIEQEKALALLAGASWAFAGPGSPSYALRQWHDTPVPAAIAAVVERGGTVCLGSAAAVLAGQFALPVYEVYKGGADAYWLAGLDLLGALTGLAAAVIPHYDNNEGGHYDTRFCYMGEQRLKELEGQLPENTGILGIDEHTAVLIDVDAATVEVVGNGSMTLRAHAVSQRFGAGTVLSLAETSAMLRGATDEVSPTVVAAAVHDLPAPDNLASASLRTIADGARTEFDGALADRDVDRAIAAVLDLEQAMLEWSADMQQGDPEYARRVLRAMVVDLGHVAEVGARDPHTVLDPYVSALLEIRATARANKDFATSDLVRDKLAAAGVEVRDTPDGATWHLRT